MEKKKAIDILEGLRGRITELRQKPKSASPDYLKWHTDVATAIQHIFLNNRARANEFDSIRFSAGPYAGTVKPGSRERSFDRGMDKADALLHSLADEVRTYWHETGTATNPAGALQSQDPNSGRSGASADCRNVFVVHGRNSSVRKAIFELLRAMKLNPLEWAEIRKATKKPNPYINEVLETGFSMARAVVVILTPDDEVRLKTELRKADDMAFEAELCGQARPNVLFEAGMAMGLHPERTVIAELGDLRPFSDIGGRHLVRLDNSPECRKELASRLESAGCKVNLDGDDWMTSGLFELDKPPIAESAGAIVVAPIQQPGADGTGLTKEESDIISSTEEDGWIQVLTTASGARVVSKFVDRHDGSVQARYLDALDELKTKRLVRPESDELFQLTGRGFEIRKTLKSKKSQKR